MSETKENPNYAAIHAHKYNFFSNLNITLRSK